MMLLRKRRIKAKLIFIVVVSCTMILLPYTLITYKTTKTRIETGLRTSLKIIGNRLESALVNPLFNFDDASINAILSSEITDKNVFAICVIDPNNVIKYGRARDKSWEVVVIENDTVLPVRKGTVSERRDLVSRNMKLGSVHLSLTRMWLNRELYKDLRMSLATVFIIDVLLLVIMYFSVNIIVVRPLKRVHRGMENIARGEGDLTQRLAITTQDEIGTLSELVNVFIEDLRRIIKMVAGNSENISRSSVVLTERSQMISSNTRQVSIQTGTVSNASASVSENLGTIAGNAVELSSAIGTASSAICGINDSLKNVAANCQRELAIAEEAGKQAIGAGESIEKFNNVAKNINTVIEVIDDLADQTNILALNATIEASSAGEAGKGFAVVAKEIKDLSNETSLATKKIGDQIEHMEIAKKSMLSAFTAIAKVIGEITSISQTITGEVDEQSKTVNEISRRISQASDFADAIASKVKASSAEMQEISMNIKGVDTQLRQTSEGIAQVYDTAKSVENIAVVLSEIIGKFKL